MHIGITHLDFRFHVNEKILIEPDSYKNNLHNFIPSILKLYGR